MAEFVPVSKGRNRLIFGGGRDLVPLPDMVEMQRESYRSFFQENVAPEDRKDFGLQELLREISPISNFDGSFRLEFLDYAIEEPKMSLHEAQHKDCTWNRPVRARVRLHDDRTQEVREEEVYLGACPVMTARGTFIINPDCKIVGYEVNDGNVGRNADELLRKLQAFQFVHEHGDEVCPAKWTPGADTLKPSLDLVGAL